jgi:catechol 2,3-dioxygenase-like lactoylglutathione lyase family enzyme
MVAVLVCIDVEDLERGIAFYTRGLGLALGRRHGAEWVELTGAPVPLMLIASPAGSRACAAAARDYSRHWTPVHLDFVVDDLKAAVERAEAAGAKREGEIQDRSWNSIAYMADPFGNGFDLIEPHGQVN